MGREKKEKKIAKTIYVTEKTDAALKAHMRRESLNNYSVAVEDALEYALFPEYKDDRHEKLIKSQNQLLSSFNQHRMKTGRDFSLLQETMLRTVKEMYRLNNKSSGMDDKEAEKAARTEFNNFLEDVVKTIKTKESMTEEDEE